MNFITLTELTGSIWYIQEIKVKDESGNILFEGENYKLSSCVYKNICQRYVRNFGTIDNVIIITLI
jgi:hypothetical protein